MFAGWDAMDNLILPKGMHEIHTGSYLKEDADAKTFYILLDTMDQVFTDKEGEYVWNFLNKE
jgi:hypothetical protein